MKIEYILCFILEPPLDESLLVCVACIQGEFIIIEFNFVVEVNEFLQLQALLFVFLQEALVSNFNWRVNFITQEVKS